MAAAKRLTKDLANVQKALPGTQCGPPADDMHTWEASLKGPEGSPYSGGAFKLQLTFPPEYPFKPPNVKFLTKMYHCNISDQGAVCLSLLKDSWSPSLNPQKVLEALNSLLAAPNPDDPLNTEAAALYNDDRDAYDKKVVETVRKHAMG